LNRFSPPTLQRLGNAPLGDAFLCAERLIRTLLSASLPETTQHTLANELRLPCGEYRHALVAATLATMTRGFRPTLRTLAIAAMILFPGGFRSYAQTQNEQQNGLWCAYFTGGPTNCGFATFEQCLAAIRGKAALCDRNQHANSAPPSATDRRSRSH
jgi:Protein of unknown function (DUF3551)